MPREPILNSVLVAFAALVGAALGDASALSPMLHPVIPERLELEARTEPDRDKHR